MSLEFPPLPQSHPDVLATAARRNGLRAASPTGARVLEVGCGSGTNLLPMARYLPEASFIGVDLDDDSLADAGRSAARLGIRNVELREWERLLTLEGEGDYLLVPNLFSFLDDSRRADIWKAARRWLGPDGVLLVRYCTETGWLFRSRLAALARRVRAAVGSSSGTAALREVLGLFTVEAIDENNVHARVTNAEVGFARRLTDEEMSLFFDNPDHVTYGFETFCNVARQEGFVVFENASLPTTATQHELALRRRLIEHIPQFEVVEDVVDYLTVPTFRTVLLARGEAPRVEPSPMDVLRVGEIAVDLATRRDDVLLDEGIESAFTTRTGGLLRVSKAKSKAPLAVLRKAWPSGLGFEEVIVRSERALARAGVSEATYTEAERAEMAAELVALQGLGVATIRSRKPVTPVSAGERPALSPLARWQAGRGYVLTTPHHDVLQLDELARHLVARLDGSRTRAALAEELRAAFETGALEVREEVGAPGAQVLEKLPEMIEQTLEGLERAGMFHDGPDGADATSARR